MELTLWGIEAWNQDTDTILKALYKKEQAGERKTREKLGVYKVAREGLSEKKTGLQPV